MPPYTGIVAQLFAGCSPPPVATPAPTIKYKLFNTPQDALMEILKSNPSIIAIGEYHDVKGNPTVESATSRFLKLLPRLKGKMTDLVLESWVTLSNCKKDATTVTNNIQATTQRPASTQDFITKVIVAALNLNVTTHLLNFSCADFKLLLKPDGQTDFSKLLTMIRDQLQKKAQALFKQGKRVVIYGGALHNDLYPKAAHAAYSFGPALNKVSRGKYAEIDLAVPEYLDKIPHLSREAWFSIYRSHVSCTKTLLIMPKPGTYIIVFPRSNCPKP